MHLIDRIRPRWRHSDPEVRALAVRDLRRESQDILRAVALRDEDPRVRRLALKKVDDPDLLVEIAGSDPDPDLRGLATERAAGIFAGQASREGAVSACAAALDRLSDPKRIAAVCINAFHGRVRQAALARVTEERTLGEIIRQSNDPDIRKGALDRIEDPTVLRGVALTRAPAAIVLGAVDKIDEAEVLHSLATDRAASKGVRQRAESKLARLIDDQHPIRVRERHERRVELCASAEALRAETSWEEAGRRVRSLREAWAELAVRETAGEELARRFEHACAALLEREEREKRQRESRARWAAEVAADLNQRRGLCGRVESLQGGNALRDLAEARIDWQGLGPPMNDDGESLTARFDKAAADCDARHALWRSRHAFLSKVEILVREAERIADAADPLKARTDFAAIETGWSKLESSSAASDAGDTIAELRVRFASAKERLDDRRREVREHSDEERAGNLQEVKALCVRLQELARNENLRLKEAHEALRTAADLLKEMGPLPASTSRKTWRRRLEGARRDLLVRFRDRKQAEDWRRWANAEMRAKLITRAEAMLGASDLARVARDLGGLQQEWRRLGAAPRGQSEDLRRRFQAAADEIRRRRDAFLADNLAQKEGLCVRVESLVESADWNAAAAAIKEIQGEWKGIGPVARRDAEPVWLRFRKACDQFFERRAAHFKEQREVRAENKAKKVALCARVEAIADSTAWEDVTKQIKQIQIEWRQVGPVARRDADALWRRFRAACDHFFERRARRGEIEMEARLAPAASICATLESAVASLAGDPDAPAEELEERLREAWAEWRAIEPIRAKKAEELCERLRSAFERVGAARPDMLARIEPEANEKRREKICGRLERLLATVSRARKPAAVGDLAAQLKEALAASALGGSSRRDVVSWDAALPEVERLKESWMRVGPVVGNRARVLADRFAKGCTEFLALRPVKE